MNIFNVPEGFWEGHPLLFVTLIVSVTSNLFLLGLLLSSWAAAHLERKDKERMEMIERIVERVKCEMKQEEREKR